MEGQLDTERLKTTMTISKAISIVTSKHTCEMVERHVRALNRIYINKKSGFLLKDLSELCKLLAVCFERLHKFPEYIEPLCKLISLCGLPFLKEKASDENTYALQVIETLALLGQLAKGSSDPIRSHVAKAVASFYSGQSNVAHKEGLQVTKLTFNAALVERSAVARSLTEALQFCEDYAVRLDLLETLQLLSAMPTNCNHMLSVGAAQVMCELLTIPDPEQRILFVGLEILWNLLEHGSQIQVAVQLSSIEGISILRYVFNDLMMNSSSVQAKQLRNDVLMICCRVAQICPDAPFVETGFLRDLCVFATLPEEMGSRILTDSLNQLKFTSQHEDFELKKALFSLLNTLSNDRAAVSVMSKEKVVRAMLSFVVSNDKAEDGLWNTTQFEELQLLALSCLSALAPLCIGDYMMCQGNTRVLLLIEWFSKDDGFKGCGNSFHGDGGSGNKLSQLRYSLRLLLSMCSTGDEMIHQDLHEQGTIPLLLGLLKKFFVDSGPIEDMSLLLEVQADILLIISCICETDMHRKELFAGYEGVQLVVGYLKRDIGKFGSGLGHHRLLLAATDCVWCTVVGNTMVEDMFLENEGIFVLLDVLKVCPTNMQNLVLGVVVDLCENPKAIPHVGAWRAGSDNSSVWSLLARLWRAEESDMDVPREIMNTLAGTLQPLMGAEQSACGVPPIPTHCPSAAIIDVTENMRAKIYALCCKMGFQIPNDELSTEDRITLCIVESYLEFKTGEVWNEVAGELSQEGLRPVTPDQECLTEILQTYEEKAEETLKIQHDLIDEQHKNEEEEELRLYEKIKQLHMVEEKPEKDFKNFVARTSNYQTLKEAKRKQLASLDASRKSNVAIGDRFHSMDQHDLNITTFCGRHVSIATTPMKLLSGNIVPTSPQHHSQSPTTIPS